LVLLRSNLRLEILDTGRQLNVSLALGVDSLLKVNIFITILVLKSLEVIQLILETDHLIFQLDDLTFTFDQLSLLALQIKCFSIDQFIQVINTSKLLRNVIFKCPGLSGQIIRFFGLHFILVVELINFFSILTVSLSQIHELSLQMLLLRLQLRIEILMLSKVTSESCNLGMSRIKDIFLSVKLSV